MHHKQETVDTKNKKSNYDTIHNIDARKIAEILTQKDIVQSTITSPPYFDMKDYGTVNQIGYGQLYDEYLHDLKNVFEAVYSLTKNNGTLWIIIDTFKRSNTVVTLPFDLAEKLKDIGWKLQDIIIWKKDKTIPWSTNGFMQKKFEYILFFSKSNKFKSNKDKVRLFDTSKLKKWWIKYPERYNPKGKALDEIWEFPIPVQGSWGDKYIKHFCPLPQEMVATMIQLSSDEKDIILDPFSGTGTVPAQAAFMNRKYIGFETNTEYINMFKEYINTNINKKIKEYKNLLNDNKQEIFENDILNLRALKFARVLLNKIETELELENLKIYVEKNSKMAEKNKLLNVSYKIISSYDKQSLENIIKDVINKPPLSKFGIEAEIKILKRMPLDNKNIYGYTKTNTHSLQSNFNIKLDKYQILSNIMVNFNESDYN